MNQSQFFSYADLMLRVLPYIGAEKGLALKGGTAINFFIKDLPRLSVDIDLTYLPLETREASLQAISNALNRIAKSIRHALPGVRVQENYVGKPQRISKLFVREQAVQI
jgi:hypothetical protein